MLQLQYSSEIFTSAKTICSTYVHITTSLSSHFSFRRNLRKYLDLDLNDFRKKSEKGVYDRKLI